MEVLTRPCDRHGLTVCTVMHACPRCQGETVAWRDSHIPYKLRQENVFQEHHMCIETQGCKPAIFQLCQAILVPVDRGV